MTVLAFEGIISSLRTALILFSAEVVVVMVMAIIIVAKGGDDGLNLHPFNPSSSPHGFGGLVTGVIFAALSFVGFEAAASLGEEVRGAAHAASPRRSSAAILLVGVIYVFCIWAEAIGLGKDGDERADARRAPWNELAATYASWMKWPVIIASVSSMFAVMVTSNNGIVRILHKMGREGLLPSFFGPHRPEAAHADQRGPVPGRLRGRARVDRRRHLRRARQPVAGGNVYGYLGFLLTMGILPVYILINAAAIRFFRGRGDFNPLRHVLLPGLGALLMVGLTVGQIVEQVAAPYTWFPWVIVGWVVLATAGALWLGVQPPGCRCNSAGAAMGSRRRPGGGAGPGPGGRLDHVGAHTIGIDVGSQSIKGCLLDPDGDVLAVGRQGCAMRHPASGWAEQDPAEWHVGLASVVHEMLERAGVAGREVGQLGLACQVDGVVPVDPALRPLRDAIIWLDRRAAAEAARARRPGRRARAVRADRPELRRVAHGAEDDVAARPRAGHSTRETRWLPAVGGYLVGWLTGEVVLDHANASSTLLYDVGAAGWSERLAEAAGIELALLPEVRDSTDVAGGLTRARRRAARADQPTARSSSAPATSTARRSPPACCGPAWSPT